MTNYTDEERRRIEAAMRYIDDPDSDPFTLEGLDHLETVLDDMMRRAKIASIVSGKGLTQHSVGEEAAFDFYYRSQSTLQMAIRAQSLSFLVKSMVEQGANTISLTDLQRLFAEVLLKATEKHKDLQDFGSSIIHLMEKASKKEGNKP